MASHVEQQLQDLNGVLAQVAPLIGFGFAAWRLAKTLAQSAGVDTAPYEAEAALYEKSLTKLADQIAAYRAQAHPPSTPQ